MGREVFTPCFYYPSVQKFSAYDRFFVTPEMITSAYNSCLHSIWTPTIIPEDIPADSSSEEQMEEEDDPEF